MSSEDPKWMSDPAQRYLTPSKEEQALKILRGECPHNRGWIYSGHSHSDAAYVCSMCGKIEYY